MRVHPFARLTSPDVRRPLSSDRAWLLLGCYVLFSPDSQCPVSLSPFPVPCVVKFRSSSPFSYAVPCLRLCFIAPAPANPVPHGRVSAIVRRTRLCPRIFRGHGHIVCCCCFAFRL